MQDARARRRWVPVTVALAAAAGAAAVLGALLAGVLREQLAIAALRSPDAPTRAAAAATLGELGTGRAISALLDCERPDDADEDMRRVSDRHGRVPAYAFQALDRIVRRGAVAELVRQAGHPQLANRMWALEALGGLKRCDDTAFAALARACEEDSPLCVIAAAIPSLTRCGRKAVPVLAATWNRAAELWTEHFVAEAATDALIELGPLAWPLVESRWSAARGSRLPSGGISPLECLDAGQWPAIAAAVERRLETASLDQQNEIAERLYDLARECEPWRQGAAELGPTLTKLLDHDNPRLREAAVYALRWATGGVSEKMLRTALDLTGELERGVVPRIWALRDIAPTSREMLRSILVPLRTANPEQHALVLSTLAESGDCNRALRAWRREPPGEIPQSWLDVALDTPLLSVVLELHGLASCPDAPPLEARSAADAHLIARAFLALAFGKLGLAARRALPVMGALLERDGSSARPVAAQLICEMGGSRGGLEALFLEAAASDRFSQLGIEGLVRLRIDDGASLRAMVAGGQNWREIERVFSALERLGPAAAPAVPLLRELAQDPEGPYARLAVPVLGAIGPAASAAVPDLASRARRMRSWDRLEALRALRSVSPTAETAALHAGALDEPVAQVGRAIAEGLIELAPHAAATVPDLVSRLRRSQRPLGASIVLSRIGAQAVPELLAALEDSNADLRVWAAWTLGGMGPSALASVQAVARHLDDPDDLVRAVCAQALGAIGAPAQGSLAALAALEQDPNVLVRRHAHGAILRLRAPEAWRHEPRRMPPLFNLDG